MKYYLYSTVGGSITKEYEVGAEIFFTYIAAKKYDNVGEWLPINEGEEWLMEFAKGNEVIGHIVTSEEEVFHENEEKKEDYFDKKIN